MIVGDALSSLGQRRQLSLATGGLGGVDFLGGDAELRCRQVEPVEAPGIIKDRGIATLKVEANIWNYLPKINRVTKVPSSMMSGSWMGSHFTNDDIVKESTYEDDYDSHISFEGAREGRAVYEMTSLPKPEAAVVWGKVVMTLDQATLAPLDALYFDEEGVLIRTMTFDQPREIDGRVVPMRLTLQPEEKPTESTAVVYHDITFGVPLEESFFSLRNLKRRR